MKTSNIKILVVDDVESNRVSLQYLINEYLDNVDLYLATDGEDALRLTYKIDIDIIILDIQMPGLDGFETAKFLKSNPKTKDIPIIFLTAAFVKEEFAQKGFEVGAIDYLTKPIEDLQLINKLKLYIEIIIKNKQLQDINKHLQETLQLEIELKKNIERQQVELIQQSKMAALGEMIGNIAHQWRQPLSVISTVASGMQINFELGIATEQTVGENVRKIVDTTQKLSSIIDLFSDYTFKEQLDEFDVNEIIKKSVEVNDYLYKQKNIDLIFDLENEIHIKNLPNSLYQVLLNLLQNAREVLEYKDGKKLILISSSVEENIVKIIIKDNGGGIKTEYLNKIFEPYFTTKHKAQGIGLGLNIVYQIINSSMNGKISVKNKKFVFESQEYEGAEFIIELPKFL